MGLREKGSLDWRESIRKWLHPKAIALLFLGFSAGLPILLIFSTLSVWLREAGVSRSAVTFFSWAALGYSFKFIWAPLVDLLPLPILTRLLGRRRGWLLLAQTAIVLSIALMASVDPVAHASLTVMALGAVCLGFSSATQDIVIDAYRIECAEESMQAMLAAMYISGYRIGMVVAGAGSLVIAASLGTTADLYSYNAWRNTYLLMAGVMTVGLLTTLIIEEPETEGREGEFDYSVSDYWRIVVLFIFAVLLFASSFMFIGSKESLLQQLFLLKGPFASFIVELFRFVFSAAVAVAGGYLAVRAGLVNRRMAKRTYVEPALEFFKRYSGKTVVLLLLLVGFYRLSDIVLGVVSNVFYLDMGFSKNVIAGITKTFGLGMTLVGGFIGGILTLRFTVPSILFLGAVLAAATNLLFMLLAKTGASVGMLTLVIGADNLAAGIATTAFIAFLSSLTSVSFTAVQYAIFSSLMTLFPKLIGGYSGTMVSSIGYENFFLLTALMGLPVICLVWIVRNLEDMASGQ